MVEQEDQEVQITAQVVAVAQVALELQAQQQRLAMAALHNYQQLLVQQFITQVVVVAQYLGLGQEV
jgi:hypothetical protein